MNIVVHKNDSLLIHPADYAPVTKDSQVKYSQNSRIQFDWWLVELDESVNNQDRKLSARQAYLKLREAELPAADFSSLDELVDHEGVSRVLNRAIQHNKISVVKDLIKLYPKKFKAAVAEKDMLGLTPAFWAVIKGKKVLQYLSLMAEAAPEEFKSSVDKMGQRGYTYLSLLVQQHALKSVKFLAHTAPVEFARAVQLSDAEGYTPVALTVLEKQISMLKLLALHAQDEFKYAMMKQGKNNETPVSLAREETLMLKYMHSISHESFMEASLMRADSGLSVLDYVKRMRPRNYKEITDLYRKDSPIKKAQKEIFNRIALSHFFDVSGSTDVVQAKTDRHCTTVDLEGWLSPQWFNLIEKDLSLFQQAYPNSLKSDETDLIRKACRFEADRNFYTPQQRFAAFKNNRAFFISTGFYGHAVTLVVWENWIAICNRGAASRGGLEVFRFNPEKLNLEVFNRILGLPYGTKENYEKVLYEDLSKELEFDKTTLVQKLEIHNHLLKDQSVGNCSLVSPLTAIYTLCLLIRASKMEVSPKSLDDRMQQAVDWYHTWLTFQRICVLARSIEPLENKPSDFKPDHELIGECLARAHMWKLDGVSSKKLKALTSIYRNSLDLKQRIDFGVWLKRRTLPENTACL